MTPTFLTLEEVIEIHRDQVTRYGGSTDLRDLGLLQSALAQPVIADFFRHHARAVSS